MGEFATNAEYSQKGSKACRPALLIKEEERQLPTTKPAAKAASTPEVHYEKVLPWPLFLPERLPGRRRNRVIH